MEAWKAAVFSFVLTVCFCCFSLFSFMFSFFGEVFCLEVSVIGLFTVNVANHINDAKGAQTMSIMEQQNASTERMQHQTARAGVCTSILLV